MAEHHHEHNHSPAKKVIEFDMFARDLAPEDDDDVRGGTAAETEDSI